MSDPLIDQLQTLTPDLVSMTNALGVPELGVALTLAEAIVAAVSSELQTRSISPAQAKATIDAATQAAITAKFGVST